MGKISSKQINHVFYVTHQLSKTESINSRQFDAIAEYGIDTFLPVIFDKKKNCLKCTIENCTPLANYLHTAMDKDTFLSYITQVISFLRICEQKVLNTKNIELSINYIFIDERLQKLRFIYWPAVNSPASANLASFFTELANPAIFSKAEHNDYISEYLDFLKSNTPFSLNNFERFIASLRGNTEVCDAAHTLSSFEGKTGKKEAQQKSIFYHPGYDETTLAKIPRDLDETAFLDVKSHTHKNVYIQRVKTNETVYIKTKLFKIGSNASLADYVVNDNKTISKHHADIIYENGRYYLMDNDSTNKSYVNGILSGAHQKTEISSGCLLRFSNEDFIFCIT